MQTSNFATDWDNPNAISIARRPPHGWHGGIYMALAPPEWLVDERKTLSEDDYTRLYYKHVLSRLNPKTVYQELGEDAVLLCYESPGDFCHRRIVADWLFVALGHEIPEIGKKKGDAISPDQQTLF